MKFYLLLFALFITLQVFSQAPKKQSVSLPIKAYILRSGLDSISKEDLLKEEIIIRLENSPFKILNVVIYLHGGESFKNTISIQTGTGNLSGIIRSNRIVNAKTPFRITIDDIWYLDQNGKKQLATGFTLVVY